MAGTAGLFLMAPFQFPSRGDMVEKDVAPGAHRMTGHAICLRIKFSIKMIPVDILVTIGTANPYFPEIPFFLLFMTVNARGGQMGSFQAEFTFIMPLNCERGHCEALGVMAECTVGLCSLPVELVPVVVGMAVGTCLVPDRIRIFRLMAGRTLDKEVPAFQFESCPGMVEVVHSFYDTKGFFVVALPAVLPETVVMNIGMAVGAVVERHSCKNLELLSGPCFDFVTFDAFCFQVLSPQYEFCGRMVEICGRLELELVMAVGTTSRQCVLMMIFMTGKAIRSQAQEGILLLFDPGI